MRVMMALVLAALVTSCGGPGNENDGNRALQVWFHTGKPAERATMKDSVARWNQAHPEQPVDLVLIPEDGYGVQLQAAASAGRLPDLIDIDGPWVANMAWKGQLRPLEDLLDAELQQRLLPSLIAQGTWNQHLYAVGAFDSGLGLYGNKRLLAAAGLRIPDDIDQAWSATEFTAALQQLAAADDDGAVLDLKLNYGGEWWTYAFSPVIQSAGGDLIDRANMREAQTVLAGPEAVAAMQQVQDWIAQGLVDPNSDDVAMTTERVALSWVGHWEYPRYRKALGEDLVVLPLPDFGTGSKTAMGSWAWAINATCPMPERAAAVLEFLLSDERVLAMSAANGAVPATTTAITVSPTYGPEAPLHLFAEQLQRCAVPRPVTPAYPVITDAFQTAFQAIRNKGDVAQALQQAARTIEQDIADNDGYPVVE
jgi:multiple sugar transport system substrate-binding protein